MSLRELIKQEGNVAFQLRNYNEAIKCYSKGIDSYKDNNIHFAELSIEDRSYLSTLLCNRAMCYIKLNQYENSLLDTGLAIDYLRENIRKYGVDVSSTSYCKALYRRALSNKQLKKYKDAVVDLKELLNYDSSSSDGLALMKEIRLILDKESLNNTEIAKLLQYLRDLNHFDESSVKSLINLCNDEKNSAMEFVKRDGLVLLQQFLLERLDKCKIDQRNINDIELILHLFSVLFQYNELVNDYVSFDTAHDLSSSKLSWSSLCDLIYFPSSSSVSKRALYVVARILKAIPIVSPAVTFESINSSQDLIESILYFPKESAIQMLKQLHYCLQSKNFELQSLAYDIISSFISDSYDYFSVNKGIDASDSLEKRKEKNKIFSVVKFRSKCHTTWAIESDIFRKMIELLDNENVMIRQRTSTCFSRFIIAMNDEKICKEMLQDFIIHGPFEDSETSSSKVIDITDYPTIDKCRRRAAIEGALMLGNAELGAWALKQPGGIQQLLLLMSTNDERCQLISLETLSLAASHEVTISSLASVVSTGVLQSCILSQNVAIKALAVSTLTKLSIKASALNDDSSEVAEILNVVLSIVKSFESGKDLNPQSHSKDTGLISFSTFDQSKSSSTKDNIDFFNLQNRKDAGMSLTSLERAIEVVAAMVGKSKVKEELVHGSSRVTASMADILRLAKFIDMRSTAAYGLAHIVCSLTVTNHELRAKALAEKDLTPEQYEQLEALQKIKAKDDNGNVIEEKKQLEDSDNEMLCKQRIKKLVNADVIPILLRFISEGSEQTKELASQSLAQINTEESIRGVAVQQGMIANCNKIVIDTTEKKSTRLYCAHAISKALVTTNPNVLSEHVRISCFGALLYLCNESEGTYLQQFEALLSIANLLSCGESERSKFVSDKGIYTVHYLMFSDHFMVRRAATEAFCNICTDEKALLILRDPEKVRLWLGFCEDWDNSDNDQAFLTARAAAGTLAMVAFDDGVCKALIAENCADTIKKLLDSCNPELIHRVLAMMHSFLSLENEYFAKYLFENQIVPSIANVMKLGNHNLVELAREVATLLSHAIKHVQKD